MKIKDPNSRLDVEIKRAYSLTNPEVTMPISTVSPCVPLPIDPSLVVGVGD